MTTISYLVVDFMDWIKFKIYYLKWYQIHYLKVSEWINSRECKGVCEVVCLEDEEVKVKRFEGKIFKSL